MAKGSYPPEGSGLDVATSRRLARIHRQLGRFQARQSLVRILRGSFPKTDGIVVARSRWFVVIQPRSEEMNLNGWEVLRTLDIKEVEYSERQNRFWRRVLRARGQKPSRPTGLELDDWESILRSANQNHPLVMISRERTSPRTCDVGQVLGISAHTLTLRPVTPIGRWLSSPWRCRLASITCVRFGCGYLDALTLALGARPLPRK